MSLPLLVTLVGQHAEVSDAIIGLFEQSNPPLGLAEMIGVLEVVKYSLLEASCNDAA